MDATILFSVVVFLIAAALMGISMLFQRKSNCLQQGTCGSTPVIVNGVKMTCSTCPHRDEPGCKAKPLEVDEE
jgi:hypothetical protein